MESHMELGETAVAGGGGTVVGGPAAKPWVTGRHRCHSCDRTRSVKVRVLSWMLGKLMLMLIIVVTSATTTFLYHKLLPDDVTHLPASAVTSPSSPSERHQQQQKQQKQHHGPGSLGHDPSMVKAADDQEVPGLYKGSGRNPHDSPSHITARLGIRHSTQGANLTMVSQDGQYFTTGHVLLVDGGLLVQRATTLFLSADIILKSMFLGGKSITGPVAPSTVVVCLSLGRGSQTKPISCQLTYLRKRDQQMARVSMLFQAEVNDRIYVGCSWPSYVMSDNNDSQQSVFTAFEVGRG